ncbi:MAG TPA: pyridoxamine 5'-phosphate oxidase family protein [Thermomicrobiales bacterium]|nr:pyridoxamine 5'-phosphate oxidase family protein [Thermomicrobiales bacterium]
MQETPEDLERLSTLLDDSIKRAGAFLRSSFEMPEKSLSARQLVTYLQGIQTVAFATVTAAGEPRVAPIGSLFYRGAFYIPTVTTAARLRHIQRRPAVSLTYYQGNDLAVIVHGQASLLTSDDPTFATLEALHRSFGSSSVNDWGDGAFIHVEAASIFTYARFPEHFPERQACA